MSAVFAHSPTIYESIYSLFNTSTAQVAGVTDVGYFLIMQPTPILTGQNSLGLNPSDERLVICLLSISYTDASDDTTVINAAKLFFTNVNALATQLGVNRNYIYLNYAGPFQNPIASYGAANVAHLKAASKKYDPHGLFQTGVPGGFKLSV
jgi:hypothetical protein